MFSDLPDLWDVNISDWAYDSATSRFTDEAFQEPYVAFVKQKTDRPVVTVGRYTSPDTMISQIGRGITDFIGAARPSIADPFLPKKIEEGRRTTTSASVSVATCAWPRRTRRACSAVRRTRPRARSGGVAGTRRRSRRRDPTTACSSSVPARLGWSARAHSDSAATRFISSRRERTSAAGCFAKARCRASPRGDVCAITESARSRR